MKRAKRRGGKQVPRIILIVSIVGCYSAWALLRPLPPISPSASIKHATFTATKSNLLWPNDAQAAVGTVGGDTIQTNGTQKPLPTASTAKIITCLVVLQAKPLKIGQPGPTITLGPSDEALYRTYAQRDGSVVAVQAGEAISEYQMLQTIMLPSANNMADSLAIWAYGSLTNYAKAANEFLAKHGIKDTHVGSDASGLSPDTTSTAKDLVKLGTLAMGNPVLAQIVGQSTADNIPVVSTIKNVNFLLGTNNIVGVKTGNSDEAGGVYVAAAKTVFDNKPVTVVSAVIGAPSLFSSMKLSVPLITSAQSNFENITVIKSGTMLGSYQPKWDKKAYAIAKKDLLIGVQKSSVLRATTTLDNVPVGTKAGQVVGQLQTTKTSISAPKTVPIVLTSDVSSPSLWWRFTHPL